MAAAELPDRLHAQNRKAPYRQKSLNGAAPSCVYLVVCWIEVERMDSLFEKADAATTDAMRKQPRFSEADFQPMFRQLQKRGQPNYSDDEVPDLFEVWRDKSSTGSGRPVPASALPLGATTHCCTSLAV
jgi:hypothetical protein